MGLRSDSKESCVYSWPPPATVPSGIQLPPWSTAREWWQGEEHWSLLKETTNLCPFLLSENYFFLVWEESHSLWFPLGHLLSPQTLQIVVTENVPNGMEFWTQKPGKAVVCILLFSATYLRGREASPMLFNWRTGRKTGEKIISLQSALCSSTTKELLASESPPKLPHSEIILFSSAPRHQDKVQDSSSSRVQKSGQKTEVRRPPNIVSVLGEWGQVLVCVHLFLLTVDLLIND